VARGLLGSIGTGMIKPNLITMWPSIVIIVSLVRFSYVDRWSASCCGWPCVALHPQQTSDLSFLRLGPDFLCFQLVSECRNCSRQGCHRFTVSRSSSGQVGRGSHKLFFRRRLSLFIVLCHIFCVIACTTCSAWDNLLFPLGPSKFSAEVCPSLVHCCTELQVTASIRDCSGVQDKEECQYLR
jgi:hypothetical protein